MTPANNISSKTSFVALTIAIILGLFFVGHVGLVAIYKMGANATNVTGIVCSLGVVALFIGRQDHRFFALLAGTVLWAVLGEIADHLGYLDIVEGKIAFMLPAFVAIFVYLVNKRFLPFFWAVSFALFFGVWASHFVMVNLFEVFGKRHLLTYASSALFAGLFIFTLHRMKKASTRLGLTFGSIVFTCCCWSILEYLWAWKVVPKPW
jgi:hypothetical protein